MNGVVARASFMESYRVGSVEAKWRQCRKESRTHKAGGGEGDADLQAQGKTNQTGSETRHFSVVSRDFSKTSSRPSLF